jgi:hypothetical protein
MFWRREKSLAPMGIRTPDCMVRNSHYINYATAAPAIGVIFTTNLHLEYIVSFPHYLNFIVPRDQMLSLYGLGSNLNAYAKLENFRLSRDTFGI